jgi:Fic-DOC domain mobile mystery protein B
VGWKQKAMIDYADGATPLEPDEIKGLKLTHISNRQELDYWEAQNIQEAMVWGQTFKKKDILNTKFICNLHKRMFSDVWSWAGKYRKTEKNIGVPSHTIEVNLQTLCDDAEAWLKYNTFSPDEFAARFHHRLVFIHPFSNGNGRHSRYMADLILDKVFSVMMFSWGNRADLVHVGDARKRYIAALKAADDHDYSLLLKFVRS